MLNVGLIGCGNIAETYFRSQEYFNNINFISCADINEDLAKKCANQYNVQPLSVDDLLADNKNSIVLNLTPPQAHYEVTKKILLANKHSYCEKPLATSFKNGQELINLAKEKNLYLGNAPDTFLGAGGQLSRKLIDEDLLDVINFDIDGFTKMTFENVRVGLVFDDVVNNVKYFLKYKKQKLKKNPQTRVTIIDMKPTQHEIEKFVKYWSPLADIVDVNHYNTWLGSQDDLNYDDSHLKDKHQNKLHQSTTGKFDFACTHPWEEMVIGADGRVGLCCLDHELKEEIGDVKTQTLQQIWQGDILKEYRNKHLRLDYQSIGSCKDCIAHTYQNEKLWAKLQQN